MDPIKPCNTYAARPSGTALYRNGKSAYKLYYVDIYGRANPERFEWELNGCPRESVLEHLARLNVEGIGTVLAFPHITKLFRFAPSAETLMHVRAFHTPDFGEVDLTREEGFVEFACYAEAIVAAEEYRFWAEAHSVDEYLHRWAQWSDAPLVDCAKMSRHFAEDDA
ncbi:MAG: hypothetical protein WCP21_06795 [Armatimonadota bacterium]